MRPAAQRAPTHSCSARVTDVWVTETRGHAGPPPRPGRSTPDPPVSVGVLLLPQQLVLGVIPVPAVIEAGVPEPRTIRVPLPVAWICGQGVHGLRRHAGDAASAGAARHPGPDGECFQAPCGPPCPRESAGPGRPLRPRRPCLCPAVRTPPRGHWLSCSPYVKKKINR